MEDRFSRKEFLKSVAKWTFALGMTPLAAQMVASELVAAPPRGQKKPPPRPKPSPTPSIDPNLTRREVWYYTKLPEQKIQCFVCPLNCILNNRETCFCRTRTNFAGTLYNEAYNNPCIIQVEPVAKGPLYHVLPGTDTLALGTAGCNLRCIFCQNWQLSQKTPAEVKTMFLNTQKALESAGQKSCRSITFTYTEPVVFYEYAYEMAKQARAQGVRSFVATAAFINTEPLTALCKVTDGFVVSIKACDEEAYKKICGQAMAPTLNAIKTIRQQGKWLELVYVIVPTINDDMKGIERLAGWIVTNVGAETPLHFLRFFPSYKLKNLPRTPTQQLEDALKICRAAGLKYVYLDNVPGHPANSTYCASCGRLLIERNGFTVIKNDLPASASGGREGKCPACGAAIPGLWA